MAPHPADLPLSGPLRPATSATKGAFFLHPARETEEKSPDLTSTGTEF